MNIVRILSIAPHTKATFTAQQQRNTMLTAGPWMGLVAKFSSHEAGRPGFLCSPSVMLKPARQSGQVAVVIPANGAAPHRRHGTTARGQSIRTLFCTFVELVSQI
ncbi:hypothetical protein [Deinococcus sonorensis]|uniref:Uncharacterized protein n=1 Tax=Deinococcus sonorensis TaxID=309891 RepID=A0ABV8YCB8_9DEIO